MKEGIVNTSIANVDYIGYLAILLRTPVETVKDKNALCGFDLEKIEKVSYILDVLSIMNGCKQLSTFKYTYKSTEYSDNKPNLTMDRVTLLVNAMLSKHIRMRKNTCSYYIKTNRSLSELCIAYARYLKKQYRMKSILRDEKYQGYIKNLCNASNEQLDEIIEGINNAYYINDDDTQHVDLSVFKANWYLDTLILAIDKLC